MILLFYLYISFINRSAVYQTSLSIKADKNYFDRPIKKLAQYARTFYQETKLMENIHKIILALSIIFMWAPMLRPPVHKLRNRKLMQALCIFFLLPIISFATWNIDLSENDKSSTFMAFYPIIYLVIYKKF
jgi:hypothetical protein